MQERVEELMDELVSVEGATQKRQCVSIFERAGDVL